MSNEPIFQKLAREYAARGTSYERMTTPYLSPVRPLGAAKQPLMDMPVYGPDQYLDGPFKTPLPKRNLAHLIQIPEPDPEFTRRMQEFVSTAPLQILQGTPAGSFIRNMQPVRTEDGGLALEAEVTIPTGDQREREKEMVLPIMRAQAEKAQQMKGVIPTLEIADEVQRFQETGKLNPISEGGYTGIVTDYEPENVPSLDEVIEVANKYRGVVLKKTITMQELIDGMTSADIIQELGQEFAEKYPTAAVAEVNVGEKLNGDMVVTVRGTLISEESGWIAEPSDEQMASDMRPSEFEKESLAYFAGKHGDPDVVRAKRGYNPEQTDESVNAASNEENDEDDEPVILAPNFWKIRDEE